MLDICIKNNMNTEGDYTERIAARALVIKNNKVAVLYSKKYNCYITIGGGVEAGETLEEACLREAMEEAGFAIEVKEQIAKLQHNTLNLYVTHHYFICELITNNQKTNFTEEEIEQELEVAWLTYEELVKAYCRICPTKKFDEWMQREYLIIRQLKNYIMV